MKTASNKLASLFVLVILLIGGTCLAQSKTDPEVEKLKKELTTANERAKAAEANVVLAMAKAEYFQKEAEVNAAAARKAEAAASMARYIAQAKLMAIRSAELTDPEQQAVVAQMAYQFNFSHRGNPSDFDVYNGLRFALARLKDRSANPDKINPASDKDALTLSDSLCKQIKRNMTKEEWNYFVGSDLPYEVACGK